MIGRNIYFKGVLWELIHKLPLLHLLIWSTGNNTFSISDIYLYYKYVKKKKGMQATSLFDCRSRLFDSRSV